MDRCCSAATADKIAGQQVSSPRARGSSLVGDGLVHGWGVVPACAGSSVEPPAGLAVVRVVPAYAGSSPRLHAPHFLNMSSPRMRGSSPACHDVVDPLAVVPAYAGVIRGSACG